MTSSSYVSDETLHEMQSGYTHLLTDRLPSLELKVLFTLYCELSMFRGPTLDEIWPEIVPMSGGHSSPYKQVL